MKPQWVNVLAILAIFITASALPGAAQIPTFSVRTREVRIDILVTDHGKPVPGLQAADFEVRDNGVLQKIEFVGFQKAPINATLVFDMSGSVAGGLLESLRISGIEFLNGLRKDERAALVTFGHVVSLGSPLTTDLDRVKTALRRVQPSGNTSLIDACYAGLKLAESKSDRPLLLVFSDGLDTSSWLTSEAVLEVAKRSDAVVYAVSAGRLPDRTFLRDLSSFTGGSLFEVESTGNLGSVFRGILEEFRQRYLLTYSPVGVSEGGWHWLKVRVKGRNLKIMARPGYSAGTTGDEKK